MKKLITLLVVVFVGVVCKAQTDTTKTPVKKVSEATVNIRNNQISITSDSTTILLDIKFSDQKDGDTHYQCISDDGMPWSLSIVSASRPLCITTRNAFTKIYVIKNK